MVAVSQQELYTVEEYFELELASEIKYEYYQGHVLAMAGANKNHNRIAVNVVGRLYNQLQGKSCELFASEMRVQVEVRLPIHISILI